MKKIFSIFGDINYELCERFQNFLNTINNEEIEIRISSFGGSSYAAITMYNLIKSIKNKVTTVNAGYIGSSANIIFLATDYKNRYANVNSVFMFHDNYYSEMFDMNRHKMNESIESINKLNNMYYNIINDNVRKSDIIIKEMKIRDFEITADESLKFGIVSKLI